MALPPLFINEERWPQDEYPEAGLRTAARVVCRFVVNFPADRGTSLRTWWLAQAHCVVTRAARSHPGRQSFLTLSENSYRRV